MEPFQSLGTKIHTAMSSSPSISVGAFSSIPLAGAVCGSAASTDLCEERQVTGVPTGTGLMHIRWPPLTIISALEWQGVTIGTFPGNTAL